MKSKITPKSIFKRTLQLILLDFLFITISMSLLLKYYQFLIHSNIWADHNSILWKIVFVSLNALIIYLFFSFFIIRVNSLCIGKKISILDCFYASLTKTLPSFFYTIACIFLIPTFYIALIMLLSELSYWPSFFYTFPYLAKFIQTYDMLILKIISITSIVYSICRFPIVGIIYLLNKYCIFKAIEVNLAILKGNRRLFLQIILFPLLAILTLNGYYSFTKGMLILNFLLVSILLTSCIVFYHNMKER